MVFYISLFCVFVELLVRKHKTQTESQLLLCTCAGTISTMACSPTLCFMKPEDGTASATAATVPRPFCCQVFKKAVWNIWAWCRSYGVQARKTCFISACQLQNSPNLSVALVYGQSRIEAVTRNQPVNGNVHVCFDSRDSTFVSARDPLLWQLIRDYSEDG